MHDGNTKQAHPFAFFKIRTSLDTELMEVSVLATTKEVNSVKQKIIGEIKDFIKPTY
jgi:hypothetical protein